jgi:hypothetical protein
MEKDSLGDSPEKGMGICGSDNAGTQQKRF